jgi:hypothetical protein
MLQVFKSSFFISSFLLHHFFLTISFAMASNLTRTMHDDPWRWQHG